MEMETFVLPVIAELYIPTLISSQSFPGLIIRPHDLLQEAE